LVRDPFLVTRPNHRIEVGVLGSITVSVDGQAIELSPVELHVVSLLAVAREGGLSADQLADELWPDELPSSWRASLRNNISRLNKKVAKIGGEDLRLIVGRTARSFDTAETNVDLWRLDRWAAEPEAVTADDVATSPMLLTGKPFAGCEISALLRSEDESVAAVRQDILSNWASRGDQLSNQMLADARRLSLDNPWDEGLAEAVALLHVSSGKPAALAAYLDALEQEVPLSPQLTELRDNPAAGNPAAAQTKTPTHAPRISQLANGPFVGRANLVDDLMAIEASGRPGVLIHGDSGIGKTRLAAEVADRLGKAGFSTAYAVADEHAFGTLQPFLDAFRGLASVVEPHLDALHDDGVQARCRREILDYIEQNTAGRLCVVVDDLHWLDDQSAALLMALCRAQFDDRIFVVGVGRTGDASARWAKWMLDLERAGLSSILVDSLGQPALLRMVLDRFPTVSRVQAGAIADQMLEQSSGIPEVANWLLDQIDPDTMEFRIDGSGATGYSTMLATLDERVRHDGAVAAVLGLQFSDDDLALLAGWPRDIDGSADETGAEPDSQDETAERLSGLIDTGLITEPAVPGRYRFVHIMASQAFESQLGPNERVDLHARAFELFDDPLRRAWHAERAVSAIGAEAAVDALLTAAHLYLSTGNYRAVTAAVNRALAIDRSLVPLADRIMNLEARERNGDPDAGQRLALTEEAIEAGDGPLALKAAAAGLPLTEQLEGDPDRIRALRTIEPESLAGDDRMWLHLHLSRQLLFDGDGEQATVEADRAWAAASTKEQQGWAWIGRRLASGIGRADHDDEWWPTPAEIENENLRFELHQAQVISTIAGGGSNRRFDLISSHVARADETAFPHIQWFSRIFEATAETDRGNHDSASRLAEAAHQLGLRAGLRAAGPAYLTQQFIWEFHQRRHGELFPFMTASGPDEVAESIFLDAAITASHFAWAEAHQDANAIQEAIDRIPALYNSASGSPFDVAVIGLVADVLAANGDPQYLSWANQRLQTRRGAYITIASAAASLGPAVGLMARLTTAPAVAADLHRQAIAQADDDGLALWQISTRLDLAATLEGDDPERTELVQTAQSLATTDWLKQLLKGRIAPVGPPPQAQ
jgi:hypothetical protein